MIAVFTKLLLAHLLGDFVLQPTKWVQHKKERKVFSKYLYMHVFLHFALAMALLWDLRFWKIATILLVTHFLIDFLKLYLEPLLKKDNLLFFIDQVLHVLVLYCCAFYGSIGPQTALLFNSIDWALVTAVVFLGIPCAVIMQKLMEKMSAQLEMDHKSLPNAGKNIGNIERLFVLVFIILGRWEAIGLLITAKSVFRFNDLKETNNRKLTEYILIGTLLSFGIAILIGLAYINF